MLLHPKFQEINMDFHNFVLNWNGKTFVSECVKICNLFVTGKFLGSNVQATFSPLLNVILQYGILFFNNIARIQCQFEWHLICRSKLWDDIIEKLGLPSFYQFLVSRIPWHVNSNRSISLWLLPDLTISVLPWLVIHPTQIYFYCFAKGALLPCWWSVGSYFSSQRW